MTSHCFRISSFLFRCVHMAGYSNAIYHTEQQKSLKSYSKNAIGVKKASKKGHFAHIGNEIKICSQNKCHHHLSNVCENSFRMFHSNWVISDYHSFVWQFQFPWLNLTNCPNKWMVIRNDPVTVKHTKWIFTDIGKVMMAFILATDFDFIAYNYYEQNGLFLDAFFMPMAFFEYDVRYCTIRRPYHAHVMYG